MPTIKIENPGELVALRMALLSGKFPPEQREWRIVGNPLLAEVFHRIFSIPLMGETWHMDVEQSCEIFDAVKRDIEFAATNNIWDDPNDEELDVRILNLVSPCSASPSTLADLKQLYRTLATQAEPDVIEHEITNGRHLFFIKSNFDPTKKHFRITLTDVLGSEDTYCTVGFSNVSRFEISSQARSHEIGFDEITRTPTGLGNKFSFWTSGGFVELYADSKININHTQSK